MLCHVAKALGICIMVASFGAMAIDVWVLRARVSSWLFTIGLAVTGASLGVGALLLMDDVSTASWILAPLAVAGLSTLHTRSLLAGEGPFRT